MPTPFYHLSLAEDLLRHPGLPSNSLTWLLDRRPEFLLGNTAPDVQTVSEQARRVTHFFDLPIRSKDSTPWVKMLREFPSLSPLNRLPSDQAGFLMGYFCHLQADWLWVKEIFVPVFGLWARWKTLPHRLYLHNVLRAYLDFQLIPDLAQDVGMDLRKAQPSGWLPFVEDRFLVQWRDFLAHQLMPGAAVQTVEVFAARQGISPEEYYCLLESEERLEQEIFRRLPRQTLQEFRKHVVDENLHLFEQMI